MAGSRFVTDYEVEFLSPPDDVADGAQEMHLDAIDFAFNPNQPRDARGRWTKTPGGLLPNADVTPGGRRGTGVSRLVKSSGGGRGSKGGPRAYTVGGRRREWTNEEARKVAESLEAAADGKSVPPAVEGRTVTTGGRRRRLEAVHAFPLNNGNVMLDVGADSGKEGTGEQELTPEQARELAQTLRRNADRDEGAKEPRARKPKADRGAESAPAPEPGKKESPAAASDAARGWLDDSKKGAVSPKVEKAVGKAFAYDDPETGMKSEVSSVTATDTGLEIVVDIRNKDGRLVGKAVRTLNSGPEGGKPQMYHTSLFLGQQAQGGGFSSRWLKEMEDRYRQNGVGSIALTSNDVGSYAWAKAGFDFADHEQVTKIADRFEKKLAGAPAPVAVAGKKLISRAKSKKRADWPTPAEFAMLGWEPGAKEWFGKTNILGTDWKGVKEL